MTCAEKMFKCWLCFYVMTCAKRIFRFFLLLFIPVIIQLTGTTQIAAATVEQWDVFEVTLTGPIRQTLSGRAAVGDIHPGPLKYHCDRLL